MRAVPCVCRYMHLGASRKAQGDAERALAAYSTSARLSPSGSEPRRGVALVLRERGRLGEALKWLEAASALAPHDAQVRCLAM